MELGLLPICEIPYAKYLDCGADMFFETVFMNWINGRKSTDEINPAGVFFRLQGFGCGVFGGNYHTHNTLHMPPGLDVVCFSNGRDYANGFRHGVERVCLILADCDLFIIPLSFIKALLKNEPRQ